MPTLKTLSRIFCSLLLSSISLMPVTGHTAEKDMTTVNNSSATQSATTVTYQRIGLHEFPYSAFLKNWDEQRFSIFYALIDGSDRYQTYFQAAYLMNNNRPASPPPEFFSKQQLLVVARVTPATTQNPESVFVVEQLLKKKDVLELHYRYNSNKAPNTYSISDGLALEIPKQAFKKVVLFENGTQVGSLDLDRGQWAMDAPTFMVPPPPPPMK